MPHTPATSSHVPHAADSHDLIPLPRTTPATRVVETPADLQQAEVRVRSAHAARLHIDEGLPGLLGVERPERAPASGGRTSAPRRVSASRCSAVAIALSIRASHIACHVRSTCRHGRSAGRSDMCSSLGMSGPKACGTPLLDFETPPSSPPSIRPAWYRGRIACMKISLATVLALALCGRQAHWVLGARQLPTEAHAWVWTENGAFGLSGRDRPRRAGSVSPSARCRPRTRGDAPLDRVARELTVQSAPHPRGCSRAYEGRRQREAVGPAPAGMLPAPRPRQTCLSRRPRTRGDAPSPSPAPGRGRGSAPHPRGCSLPWEPEGPTPTVGPAPAGMLLRVPRSIRPLPGRPRTRGDAPQDIESAERQASSAPHPRGCSAPDFGVHPVVRVGPAPAGMLPRRSRRAARSGRRPRTRGDAPPSSAPSPTRPASAPHPRGCSARRVLVHDVHRVGPAPAGMLHQGRCTRRPTPGRPRTRGDAPPRVQRHVGVAGVGPAPAGMLPPPPEGPGGGSWVGPAPAGMLRPQRRRRRTAWRRPRTRGDAPASAAGVSLGVASAPHPR